MNRLAKFSASLALVAAAGLAQAAPGGQQVSPDDHSKQTGPSAAPAGNKGGAMGASSAGADAKRNEVVQERDKSRAMGKQEPGTSYKDNIAAPNDPKNKTGNK